MTGAQGFATGIAISKMLKMKKQKQFFLVYVSVALIAYLLFTYAPVSYLGYRAPLSIISTTLVCLFYSIEKKGKVLCAALLTLCVMAVLELLLSSIWDIFAPIGTFEAVTGESHLWFVLAKLFYLLLYVPALVGMVWLWNRIARRGEGGGMTVGLALFPFSQAVLIAQVCFAQYAMGERTFAIYATCAMNFAICVAADLLLLREIRRLRKLHELEQKQLQVEKHMAVQETYYRYLEERVAAVSKLRHDMNNQLQTAFTLLRHQESDVAREQLEQLQQSLADTRPRRYSSNPIVDAVLADKGERCEEMGIKLSTNLDFPSGLNMEPSALCSILSNLLDNALRGCETCEGQRFIRCEGMTQGEHIVIEVVNSKGSLPPHTTGHGLGLVILREIAVAHNGRLEVRDEAERFTATIWLSLKKKN